MHLAADLRVDSGPHLALDCRGPPVGVALGELRGAIGGAQPLFESALGRAQVALDGPSRLLEGALDAIGGRRVVVTRLPAERLRPGGGGQPNQDGER